VKTLASSGAHRLRNLGRLFLFAAVVLACSMLKTVPWRGGFFSSSSNFSRSFNFLRQQFLWSGHSVGRSRDLASLAVTESGRQVSFAHPTMSSDSVGNFDLLKRVQVSGAPIQVSKWRSRVTGLSVVHVDYEGRDRPHPFIDGAEHSNSSYCEGLLRSSHRDFQRQWMSPYTRTSRLHGKR
jgi:hypothetical protein